MKRVALIAAALFASSTALAADTYMWGGGIGVGTMVVPSKYPVYFPTELNDRADNNNSSIEGVGGDFRTVLEGVYYLDAGNRVGVAAGYTFGSDFSDRNLMLKYAKTNDFGAADGIVGVGSGVGRSVWKGEGSEELNIPYYPIRAELGAMHRDKDWAVQGTIYGQYNWEATSRSYTDTAGNAIEDIGRGLYAMVGVELTGMYGDFKPPKKDKDKKSSSKSNDGSKSSGNKSSDGGKSGGGKSDGAKSDDGGKSGGGKSGGGKTDGGKTDGAKSGDKTDGGKSGGKSGGGKSGDGDKTDGGKSGAKSGDKSGDK